TKKLRLAITVGSMLAGQKVATNPMGMIKQASELIEKNPELAKIQQRITGELFDAARTAALSSTTSRVDALNDRIVNGRVVSDEDEYDEDEDEQYDEDEGYDEPEDEEAADEPEDEEAADEPEDEEAADEPQDEAEDDS